MVMPQLINWKPDGLTWPAWVVSLELQAFAPFDCDADINIYHPKWSKTGVRVKTLLYREETLLSQEKQTPLYWLKAPPPKLLCHEGGRLSFVNRCIASFHAYLREYCVFKAIILKKRNLSKKNVIQEKWEEGWASLKDVLHVSTHYSFLARTLLLI